MKLNRKILLMNIAILVMIAGCFTFIVNAGDEYSMHTHFYCGNTEINSVTPEFTDDGVVEMTGYRVDDNNELIIELKSVGKGSTGASFRCEGVGTDELSEEPVDRSIYSRFTVGGTGVIFETYTGLNFGGYEAVIYTLLLIMMLIEAVMLWMYLDYRRKGDFCYPMIACGGMAIFMFILMLFGVYKILNNVVNSFDNFISVISDIGNILLIALSPAMLILAVLLAFSNIWLIRHEGFRPVNTLGIIFAVLWFCGTALTLFPEIFLQFGYTSWFSTVQRILTYIICYFECMFLSTVASSYLATKYKPALDRDYIIILGCAIRADGTPTPLLKARVDSAADFEKEQFEKTGKHAKFVPSGGQGSDEVISESDSMANYLMSRGIPEEQIIREDKSVNTMQNMQFSKEKIESDTDDFKSKRIAFATTNYHVFRGYILAKKNGFEAKGISAKTKPYFYPNAFLREFIGLLVDQKFKHVIFVVIILALFLAVFNTGIR